MQSPGERTSIQNQAQYHEDTVKSIQLMVKVTQNILGFHADVLYNVMLYVPSPSVLHIYMLISPEKVHLDNKRCLEYPTEV